jgi:hypothetical protein
MKQQQIGNYGWTPQQMARVNAQRESRGQRPLLDNKMRDDEYMGQYDSYLSQMKPKAGGTPKSPYDIEGEKPLKEKMEEEQNAFRERFLKRQMLPSSMGGMRGAVSSPTYISRSYDVMG